MANGRTTNRGVCLLLALAVVSLVALPSLGAPSPEQRQKLMATRKAVAEAETLYKNNKISDAIAAFGRAQTALVELAAMPEVAQQIEPLKKRLTDLHDSMELDGAKIPPIAAELKAAPAAKTTPDKPAMPDKPAPVKPVASKTPPAKPAPGKPVVAAAAPAGTISFVRQIGPLLVEKCGKCHVSAAKGGFRMTNFNQLMRGSKDGVVIMPNKGKGSRIVEVIESGDMPRGGGKVSPEELALLTKWIDQGAKFDGRDPQQPLAAMSPTTALKGEKVPKLDVALPTGKETISFARDIATVLSENCLDCHGMQNPGGNLRMTDFNGLLKGGNSGLIVEPGKPAESLLVKKLKGTAGDRMPLRRPPLTPELIAKFEKWITEGARFDGADPAKQTEAVADLYRAQHASHDELKAERAAKAPKIWRLAIPDDPGRVKETKNFLVIGNVSQATLDDVSDVAEVAATKIARMFKSPEDKPLVKGRITLFVCRQRYDYTEFGQMVEERQIPATGRGHLHYDGPSAYGCIVPPTGDDYSLLALIGQQAGGLYIADLGHSPRWFYEGAGAAIGLHLNGRDARLKKWEDAIPRTIADAPKPELFLKHGLSQEENDVLSFGFVRSLMARPAKFQELLSAIRQKPDADVFEMAFQRAYGGKPSDLAAAWLHGK